VYNVARSTAKSVVNPSIFSAILNQLCTSLPAGEGLVPRGVEANDRATVGRGPGTRSAACRAQGFHAGAAARRGAALGAGEHLLPDGPRPLGLLRTAPLGGTAAGRGRAGDPSNG